jgi:hypothetical protein
LTELNAFKIAKDIVFQMMDIIALIKRVFQATLDYIVGLMTDIYVQDKICQFATSNIIFALVKMDFFVLVRIIKLVYKTMEIFVITLLICNIVISIIKILLHA